MEIQTNHNLRLLNAKCEYVCIVDNLSKKLDYGDNIECCLNKLYLASKLINRLECYCFKETKLSTISNGTCTIEVNALTDVAYGTYYLYSDNVILSTALINSPANNVDLISQLLGAANIQYEIEGTEFYITFYANTNCNQSNLIIKKNNSTVFTFDVSESPICEVVYSTCYNCIEQSNLREMYAVLDNLLS